MSEKRNAKVITPFSIRDFVAEIFFVCQTMRDINFTTFLSSEHVITLMQMEWLILKLGRNESSL